MRTDPLPAIRLRRARLVLRAGVYLFLAPALAAPVAALPQTAAGADSETPISGPQAPPGALEPTLVRLLGVEGASMGDAMPSPDGSWIAFRRGPLYNETNLYLLPAEGGEPVRLTEGEHTDGDPRWVSESLLLFRSSRPGDERAEGMFLMSLRIDPATGRVTSPPRQVSLHIARQFVLSPDRDEVVYLTDHPEERRALEVIPLEGGPERVVVTHREIVGPPAWSADGRWIYFVTSVRGEQGSEVHRVPAHGGEAEVMSRWPRGVQLEHRGRALVHFLEGGLRGPARLEIAKLDGTRLGSLELPAELGITAVRDGGRTLLAARQDYDTRATVRPLMGGPARRLTEASGDTWLYSWDSPESLLVETAVDGERVLLRAQAGGGEMRSVELPGERVWNFVVTPSEDGRYLLYAAERGDPELAALRIYDTQTGRFREITRSLPKFRFLAEQMSLTGRGGTYNRDGDRFLFYTREGDRLAVWAVEPEGEPRRLWTFPAGHRHRPVAVAGDRVAFGGDAEPEGILYLATPADEDPRALLRRGESLVGAVWSRDGRRLVAAVNLADERDSELLVLDVGPDGRPTGDPRVIDVPPFWWWGQQWLPDDRGVVLVGFGRPDALFQTGIWLVPLEGGRPPVELTGDDPGEIWDVLLSPDGDRIAYGSGVPVGSSVWRIEVDLP